MVTPQGLSHRGPLIPQARVTWGSDRGALSSGGVGETGGGPGWLGLAGEGLGKYGEKERGRSVHKDGGRGRSRDTRGRIKEPDLGIKKLLRKEEMREAWTGGGMEEGEDGREGAREIAYRNTGCITMK